MSSTNKTSNLELSQFIGTDSPKWLTDYNSDMQKIDAGVAAVQTQANATDLVVSGHTSSISANAQSISDQQTAITSLRTDVTAAQGSINTINSLIGNGEPTTTDKTIIGAINELAAEIQPSGGVSAASVSYDNTDSGLTASNVQAAIDEIVSEMPSPTTQLPATSITYNNTSSGLTASNAQAAIDELAAKAGPTLLGTFTASGSTNLDVSNYTKLYLSVVDGTYIHSSAAVMVADLETGNSVVTSCGSSSNSTFTPIVVHSLLQKFLDSFLGNRLEFENNRT